MPKESEIKRALLNAESPVKFAEFQEIADQWMLQADPHVLKIMSASIVANKLPGDPVWIFLVGPSGGGKTMILSMFNQLDDIYQLSNLTPNTFVSGQRNVPGLLYEINGKILTFKDFTTILQLYQEARNEIMSQMREIYDGSYKKKYGTGEERDWVGKIGFIAGVTTVIDVTSQIYSALGERFIQYRLITPDRKAVGMHSIDNSSRKKAVQDDIKNKVQEYFARYIHGVVATIDPEEEVGTSHEQKEKLVRITDFITLARSPVMRDGGPSREIYFKPSSEMPTRFTQQLNHLCMALMIMNRYETGNAELTDDDELSIYKVALDSIPMMRRIMLQKITQYDQSSTVMVATLTNYPTSTTKRILEELNVLGLVDRIKDKGKKSDLWKIKDEYRSIMEEYDHIVPVDEAEREIKEKEVAELEDLWNAMGLDPEQQ
ncbi:hypothetical protein M0R04_10030 [Candidatus Dojkabacteria bacterium]|jgi:hypothetical protein|nr:hypothetical protein [Candidatus Dojkabacteria bacterium]